MFPSFKYKAITTTVFAGLFLSQASFTLPRKNVFDTCIELSLYLAYLGLAGYIIDNICQNTPTLCEQNSCDEKHLQYIEDRINQFKFILESPSENALIPFRSELKEHYDRILKNRHEISIFFERNTPCQPWALLSIEIEEQLNSLHSFRSKLYTRVFTKLDSQSLSHEQALQFFDRIQKVEDLLIAIKNTFQAYPSFQSECYQARQEKIGAFIIRQVGILTCLYLINTQGKYLGKYCS
ncbi:MAG: hypothetical protein AMXMBFR12_10200 [Candidatus Babeliales bacterium]